MSCEDPAAEEMRRRRSREWYESRFRCGHATVCPLCGDYTVSKHGYHPICAKKAGIKRPKRKGRNLQVGGRAMPEAVGQGATIGRVVREDGAVFESPSAAALSTYGYCGASSNIKRAVRTGCRAGGYRWKEER
nr:MAG TPA: ISL3 zinc-finger of transposase IS204/IS1001/IS1096/IS1165 [Caudoviricetes sp.]